MGTDGGAGDRRAAGAEDLGPPEPPSGTRRPRVARTQAIGITLLAVPVLLALLGIIDEHPVTVQARASGVRVEVEYPQRLRHHVAVSLRIRVDNEGGSTLPDARVSISPDYLGAFEDVSFSPSEVSPGIIELGTIPSGARREVEVQLRATRSYLLSGEVGVEVAGEERVRVNLRSWVWP